MRVHKSHFERLRLALAASVVALLASAPALAAETAQPAAARYVPTLEDYMGVYAALQKYRDGTEKHDDKLQRSAFWEDAGRGGGRNAGPPPGANAGPPGANAGPPPGANAGAPGANAGPPPGANARRPTWEEIKAMPGYVEVWHLPLDSYIHFESATRATHYEYYLSIYPQPEKPRAEGVTGNMQNSRVSIAGWPGHYDDILEKRNGEWRILQRQMRINEK